MGKNKNNKRAPNVRRADIERRARGREAPVDGSTAKQRPTFCFKHADRSYMDGKGPWGYHRGPKESHEVSALLCEMSAVTWGEIENQMTGNYNNRHKKHHDQPIESLCSEAQDRIAELHLEEYMPSDQMFRFRNSGTARLWGFRAGSVFHVVWWDPDHKVCPTS